MDRLKHSYQHPPLSNNHQAMERDEYQLPASRQVKSTTLLYEGNEHVDGFQVTTQHERMRSSQNDSKRIMKNTSFAGLRDLFSKLYENTSKCAVPPP
jgi:hypothetical protein